MKLPPNRARLSQLHLTRARPRDKAYNIWDSSTPGLCLRIQPSGARALKFVFSYHGKPQWFNLGQLDLAAARKIIATELRPAVVLGRNPCAEKRAHQGDLTFGELADAYLKQHAQVKNRSWKVARRLVERFGLPAWNSRPAKSISRSDVKAVLSKIEATYVVNSTLAAVSAILSFGVREEFLETNVARGISKNAVRSRARVLSDSELPLIWKALDSMATPEARACQAILTTGQRPGEVLHLRREHVRDGVWCMPGAPDPATGWPGTKNSQDHRVPLPPPVLDAVNGCKSGFVFGGPRGRLDRVMQYACKAAGIADRVRPHDLRRSFGTMVCALGFGRQAMDRLLNHSDKTVGSIYDRFWHWQTLSAVNTPGLLAALEFYIAKFEDGEVT